MEKYQRRGCFSKNFMKELPSFSFIKEISNESKELDLQFRGGYIDVYYRGGKLLRLSGSKTIDFDYKYYHLPTKRELTSSDISKLTHENYKSILNDKPSKLLKNAPESEIEENRIEATSILKQLKEKRDAAVTKLSEATTREETEMAMAEMMKQMDNWKNNLTKIGRKKETKDERSVQQYISLYNKKFDNNKKFDKHTDFMVLDIEYSISSKSKYCKQNTSPRKQPRLDIISIDRNGQLYVMELKYGMKSVDLQSAGALDHINDFNETVGKDNKWNDFMEDIKVLFESKKKYGLIEENVILDTSKAPIFAFVMKCTCQSDVENFRSYLQKKNIEKTLTLYLREDNEESYPEQNYKLSNTQVNLCK